MTTPAVKIDAKNRAMRTLVQGLLIDLVIAIGTTAYGILNSESFTWTVLGLAVLKTLATTLASYVMRIKLGNTMLRDTTVPDEPIKVQIGDYELELQRPGVADHSAA
jgi:hypothetical protein